MGIENLSLKRNDITILSNKSNRGWEIRLESEKLYYFTINILGQKKKTLPIPFGKVFDADREAVKEIPLVEAGLNGSVFLCPGELLVME
jgi:neutral trehalase